MHCVPLFAVSMTSWVVFQSSREAHSPTAKEMFLFFTTYIHLFNIKVSDGHVLCFDFQGTHHDFNNLMFYPSCATFHLAPWGHTLAMGDAFVSGLSKVCTVSGAVGRRRCCIRTMGHCPLEQTATVMVAGTNTHHWSGCYIFWVKRGDFPHLWRCVPFKG